MTELAHPYPPGTRVRHSGQQYWNAMNNGTACVVAAVPQRDGTWEYLINRDDPLWGKTDTETHGPHLTWWASYHTRDAWLADLPDDGPHWKDQPR